MKKTFAMLLFAGMILGYQAQAQMTFGVKAGLNLANVSAKVLGEDWETDGVMGYHIGGFMEMELTKELYFQPGLLVSQKGYGYSFDFGLGSVDATVKPVFLEIPLNVGYRYHEKRADWSLVGQAGPYLGYAFMGKKKADSESEDIKFGSDSESDMKPLDFGLNFALGFEYNQLFGMFNYGFGMANLVPEGDGDNKISNGVIGISVGYKFGK